MKPFTGKVALVTGGSSGLGEATALKFAEQGAKVVIAARRVEQSNQVMQRIQKLGGEAHFIQTDLGSSVAIENMVKGVIDQYGRLDCAVNNAGIVGPRHTPLADVTESQWDEVMNINLKAVWLCMKYEIPAMLKQTSGAIVNVSSIYGNKPSDIGHGSYSTSKHGVIALTKAAAADYGQMALRINAVAPGFTLSEMVDPSNPVAAERYKKLVERHSGMKRLGLAEETANAIVWLCSDQASYINGTTLTVDGGSASRLY